MYDKFLSLFASLSLSLPSLSISFSFCLSYTCTPARNAHTFSASLTRTAERRKRAYIIILSQPARVCKGGEEVVEGECETWFLAAPRFRGQWRTQLARPADVTLISFVSLFMESSRVDRRKQMSRETSRDERGRKDRFDRFSISRRSSKCSSRKVSRFPFFRLFSL